MPLMRKAPEKLFTKEIISKGHGFLTPQYGSACKIRVISDEANLLTGVCENQTKEIIIGDIDDPNLLIIEDCIRTMKDKEECCIAFCPFDADINNINYVVGLEIAKKVADDIIDECFKNVKDLISLNKSESELQPISCVKVEAACISKSDAQVSSMCFKSLSDSVVDNSHEIMKSSCTNKNMYRLVKIQFQLLSFTRELEIWEMDIAEKYSKAQHHRTKGQGLYVCEMYSSAFKQFVLALKYGISLEQDLTSVKDVGIDLNFKEFKLSCYLNIAACQLKHSSFTNVVINTSKALNLQTPNAKAFYRRGVAYVQLQEYEKAREDLTAAQQLLPKDQAINKQLQILKNRIRKLNQHYAIAMKKMFS